MHNAQGCHAMQTSAAGAQFQFLSEEGRNLFNSPFEGKTGAKAAKGWLYKRGSGIMKLWKIRWCELAEDSHSGRRVLNYYTDESKRDCRGCIELSFAKWVSDAGVASSPAGTEPFRLFGAQREWVLAAPKRPECACSPSGAKAWLEFLRPDLWLEFQRVAVARERIRRERLDETQKRRQALLQAQLYSYRAPKRVSVGTRGHGGRGRGGGAGAAAHAHAQHLEAAQAGTATTDMYSF
jgi:hypothetical protein